MCEVLSCSMQAIAGVVQIIINTFQLDLPIFLNLYVNLIAV